MREGGAHRAFVVVVLLGVALFALALFAKRTTLAFSLGTTTSAVVADLGPQQTLCQGPVDVPSYGRFDRVVLQVGTYQQPGPPLDLRVRSAFGETIASGRLPGGYSDIDRAPTHSITLPRMIGGADLRVCVTNRGARRIALYGSGDNASQASTATLNGKRIGRDVNFEFRRPARSYVSMVGRLLERASLWRSPRFSGGVYVGVLIGLLGGALVATGLAVRRSTANPPNP